MGEKGYRTLLSVNVNALKNKTYIYTIITVVISGHLDYNNFFLLYTSLIIHICHRKQTVLSIISGIFKSYEQMLPQNYSSYLHLFHTSKKIKHIEWCKLCRLKTHTQKKPENLVENFKILWYLLLTKS